MTVSSMLPQWSSSTLSDVTTIIRGVTYKKEQASNQPFTGSLAILRANNIQGGSVIVKDLVYVPSDLVKPHQRLLKGDIVVAMSSGSKAVVGKTARIKENFDGSFGAFCGLLRPVPEIIPTYLAWFTHSLEYRNRISSLSAGANINNLKPSHFDEIQIPLAPLTEQKVIADKLDTLLAQVETTKARLERIPQILKRFRQSVLAAAVSGRLTEEWRESPELTGWESDELGRFIEKPRYGSSAKSQKSGDIPVLRMGNLQDGRLDWADLVYTSDPEEIEKYRLEPGDVLFNRTNSPELVGKTSIFRGERDAIYAGYLIKIKCLSRLNPEFLNYQLNSPKAKDYCKAVKSDGVSQSNINAKKLAAYPLNCPPLEEQTEIVRRVDQLFAHADRIEQQVNNALARVNNLTQSILAKAFRGELTEQWRTDNPELISGENSAEALLERIRAERAAVASKSKRRPTKV